MNKINWKFYRPYRDKLVDKKNEVLSHIFDKKKKNINLMPSEIKRILFLRTDGKIGDYIISSFIFREIRKNYPNIKIDVVADKSLENLLKLNKNINKYYILDRKKMQEWRSIAKTLGKNNYDVLFDSTEGLKYKQVYLLNRVNATVNVGYNKDGYHIYNKNIKQNNTLKMIQIYKQMVESVNIEIKDTKYDVPVSEESEKNVAAFIEENNSDLVVSLDTSILHIAEGLDKKIMAFYGPKINKNKWRIREEGNILIDYPENRINDVNFEKMFDELCQKNALPAV